MFICVTTSYSYLVDDYDYNQCPINVEGIRNHPNAVKIDLWPSIYVLPGPRICEYYPNGQLALEILNLLDEETKEYNIIKKSYDEEGNFKE